MQIARLATYISPVIVLIAAFLFVQPDAPVHAIGEFSDVHYTEEHAYGYAVQLWRADDEIFGLFLASDGLAGDTPTGRLQNVRFDRGTGKLHFHARVPVHGLLVFDGILSGDEMAGELTHPSTAKTSSVQLCLLAERPHDFPNFERWEEWARTILSFRGPKPYPITRYLARGVVLEEAVIPSTWSLPKPVAASDAVRFAIDALESRGVSDIRICGVQWIQAPLGAAIVLATGCWQSAESTFSAFAIALHDGTEVKYGDPAGKEYSFLARGADAKHREVYFTGEGLEPEEEYAFEFVSKETLGELAKKCH